MRFLRISIFGLSIFVAATQVGRAQQQSIGSVGVQDATVAGALEVSGGRALLVGNTTVTARDKTAEVELKRGGMLRVCATTGLHVTAGAAADNTGSLVPLMLAIDRGAIEVQMPATTRDVVTTPDLRFTMRGDGPLDLQLRVTRNGDTCVENRGAKAPVLNVADQFGEATYELKAGQHVLFEHGSLKEVVDHESSACGCPPEPTMSVADALVNANGSGARTAAEAHPFPAAVSAGLAPATVPQSSAGSVHTQVTATLNAGGAGDTLAATKASPDAAAETAKNSAAVQTPPAPAKSSNNPFRAVGRFFKKIFGGG